VNIAAAVPSKVFPLFSTPYSYDVPILPDSVAISVAKQQQRPEIVNLLSEYQGLTVLQ
jgi:hypothetical protein